jgi:hypothetical protein
MVLSEGTTEKSQVTPSGIDPGTVRLVAQRLNHYATPGPAYLPLSRKNQAYGKRFNWILFSVRHIFGHFEFRATAKEQSISVTYALMTSLQDI